jgi:EAL domain-containing protein (putative c-di-GMP-specific phosphodiesterase class I)
MSAIAISPDNAELQAQATWFLTGRMRPGDAIGRFAIDVDPFMVGRHDGANLPLPSRRVSGRHAEFLRVAGHLFLRDLSSTNGTYVNHRRVHGAQRVDHGDHVEFADMEFRIDYVDPAAKNDAPSDDAIESQSKTCQSMESLAEDWILSQFETLISKRAINPHFQPILEIDGRRNLGYEALARSDVPGLQQPATMFGTAALLEREVDLSHICRDRAIEVGQQLPGEPLLFVNTHPNECLEQHVLPHLKQLRARHPDVKIVLEVHEGSVAEPRRMRDFAARLRHLDVKLAYDDFGAGQSRLLELAQAPPHILKFDRALIQGIDGAPALQFRMLTMLTQMAHDFCSLALAEGIETAAEAEACRDAGFDLAQGYYYGRPQSIERLNGGETREPQSGDGGN